MTRFVVFCFILLLLIDQSNASCFNRTLSVTRYHYLNPANIASSYQDIYKIKFTGAGSGATAQITRLTSGAIAANPYDNTFATWSPDGTRIAFGSTRSGGYIHIYVMNHSDSNNDGQGDNLVQVTNDNFDYEDLFWGTGNKIVYTTYKSDPGGKYQVHIGELSPSTPILMDPLKLTSGNTTKGVPVLSPDGLAVLFQNEESPHPNRTQSVNHVLAVGGATTKLIDNSKTHQGLHIKPDNSTLVTSSNLLDPNKLDLLSRSVDLTVSPPTVSNPISLDVTPSLDKHDPVYSPDGACLAFLGNDNSVIYGPNSDLYIRDLASGTTHRMTSSRDIAGVAWMP